MLVCPAAIVTLGGTLAAAALLLESGTTRPHRWCCRVQRHFSDCLFFSFLRNRQADVRWRGCQYGHAARVGKSCCNEADDHIHRLCHGRRCDQKRRRTLFGRYGHSCRYRGHSGFTRKPDDQKLDNQTSGRCRTGQFDHARGGLTARDTDRSECQGWRLRPGKRRNDQQQSCRDDVRGCTMTHWSSPFRSRDAAGTHQPGRSDRRIFSGARCPSSPARQAPRAPAR